MPTQFLGHSHRDRREVIGALVSSLAGGVIGWSGTLAGLGAWGLALGAAITGIVILALAYRPTSRLRLSSLCTFGFAFVTLTWPFLWIAVGYVRYVITGTTLGK
jgi:hypothetical protein